MIKTIGSTGKGPISVDIAVVHFEAEDVDMLHKLPTRIADFLDGGALIRPSAGMAGSCVASLC